jgi:hypothetical protein
LPHIWLMGFVGIVLLVIGCVLLTYILLPRYETVEVHKEPSKKERSSEVRESPQTLTDEASGTNAPPEPEQPQEAPSEHVSWWRRWFG